MICAPPSSCVSPAPTTAAERFACIISSLCQHIAHNASVQSRNCIIRRIQPTGLAVGPFTVLLWTRLSRISARFTLLAAKLRDGTLRPAQRRRPSTKPRAKTLLSRTAPEQVQGGQGQGPGQNQSQSASPPKPKLPCSFAWLIRLLPGCGVFRSQLQYLCTDPEFRQLLTDEPRLGLLIRPVFYLLGLRPDPTIIPPPPGRGKRRKRPRRPRRPRPDQGKPALPPSAMARASATQSPAANWTPGKPFPVPPEPNRPRYAFSVPPGLPPHITKRLEQLRQRPPPYDDEPDWPEIVPYIVAALRKRT